MASIYDAARFYDIGFGWRDVPAECEFMLGRYRAARGRAPTRVLELACGPGQHARTFAARGLRTVGLDVSEAMLRYARQQPGGDDPDLTWLHADMRDFALDAPVELACCLMDSLSHLLTLDDLLAHLDSVARNMVAGGSTSWSRATRAMPSPWQSRGCSPNGRWRTRAARSSSMPPGASQTTRLIL